MTNGSDGIDDDDFVYVLLSKGKDGGNAPQFHLSI